MVPNHRSAEDGGGSGSIPLWRNLRGCVGGSVGFTLGGPRTIPRAVYDVLVKSVCNFKGITKLSAIGGKYCQYRPSGKNIHAFIMDTCTNGLNRVLTRYFSETVR